jgi:uncharacterized membrane protein YhaH (DUF805 family)
MNTNLLDIVKQIIADYGEAILEDPQRLKALFGDLAKDEPKPLRIAFGRCIESGAYTALKTAPDTDDRAACKTTIAQQVRDEHGLDMTLCAEALDILEEALFGTVLPQQQPAPVTPQIPPVMASPTAAISSTASAPQPAFQKASPQGYHSIIDIIRNACYYLTKTFKNNANFKGRSCRAEFWWYVLFASLGMFVVSFISNLFIIVEPYDESVLESFVAYYFLSTLCLLISPFYWWLVLTCVVWTLVPLIGVISLVFFLLGLALAVRRMHDCGKSGGFILIPVYGFILTIMKGTSGPNRFGPDPKAQ